MSTISRLAIAATMLTVACPAAAQVRQFDIPAQSAAGAIRAFSRQTGLQVLAPSASLSGKRTAALRGRFDTEVALGRLIAGTGLEVARRDGRTVVLRVGAVGDGAAAAETAIAEAEAEEVLVTAQRRIERAQDVPVAITAFNEEAVDDYRLQTLRDVSRLTPGLLVSNFSLSSPIIAVRGATNTFNQIGANKPVAIVVDDVYIPRNSAATLELFGVDSIQVLKGPQGTLFGRNVTGGAIVIDTGRPAFDATGFDAELALASYDTVNADALVDLPLGDSVSARLVGTVRRHDGWGRDRLTGQELDDQQSEALRGQLRARIAEPLELLIAGDYASDSSGGRTLSSIGAGNDGDRRTSETGFPQAFEREQGGISGRLFWETGIGDLVSITAWRRSRTRDIFSNVGTNFRFLTGTQSQATTNDRDRVNTFSQEVRLASPAWRQGNFVLGGYFASEDATRQLRTGAFAAVSGNLITDQLADQDVDSKTYAVFADGTVNLTSWLGITLGGRYTWDEKRASLTRTDFIRPVNNFTANGLMSDWSRFTPRAVVKVTPADDLLAYLSYARGYTAGGYNTEAATVAALRQPFDPETLENIELGFKGAFLDRRVRIDVSAFRMKYDDKQELFFNNVTRVLNIVNAAEATMKGVELSVSARPVRALTLTGTYGHLDTRYDDFVIPGGAVNTGNRLGSSPEDKASAAVDLDLPVGRIKIDGNLVYSYTSGYFTGAAADAGLFVPGYSLVNASIGLADVDERWRVRLFARNLFDKEYLLIPSVQVVRAQYLGEPRILGVATDFRF